MLASLSRSFAAITILALFAQAPPAHASENLLDDQLLFPVNGGAANCENDCGAGCPCEEQGDWTVLLRGAGTYFDTPTNDDWLGGAYGGDFAGRLSDDWGFVGSAYINHLDFGRQIVGSLGLVKLPYYCGCDWQDSLSASIFFDQFTDTRIDTRTGSLYLSQVRAQLGYAFSQQLEIGTLYTAPVRADDDVQFLFTFFPNSLPADGIVKTGHSVSGYAAGRVFEWQWTALAGYRFEPGTPVYGGSIRRAISDRAAIFSGAIYEANRGNWGLAYGIEIALGPSFNGCGNCCPDCCRISETHYSAARSRSQSPDANIHYVNVPQGTPETPAGPSVFPPGLGQDAAPFIGDQEPSWTERWFDWNARQLTVALPQDFWRALNADGLTDRQQDAIQNAAGGFSLKTRKAGGFGPGRNDGRQSD